MADGDREIPDYTPAQLKQIRERVGWSRTKMGEYLNMSPDAIKGYETPESAKSHRKPNGSTLKLYSILQTKLFSGDI